MKLHTLSPVGRFFLQVLIWLPLMFMAWFYMAIVVTWPVTWLADLLLPALLGDLVSGVEQSGYMVDVVTRVAPNLPPGRVLPEGQVSEVIISINPLMYGFGIPLFTALLLATPEVGGEGAEPGEDRESDAGGGKGFYWLLGLAVLIPVQVFGLSMDLLKTLLFEMGPAVAQQTGFPGWYQELVALGYQLGYLILPAVTPVALWIGLHRHYIEQLAPGLLARLAR